MAKTYAYIRVSTLLQDYDSQRTAIDVYANKHCLRIDEYIEDRASGTKPWKKRKLGAIQLEAGDVVILNEISRIGRNLLDILEFLNLAVDKGAIVHVAQLSMIMDGIIGSKVISMTLGLVAEIERDLLSTRVKEGLVAAKKRGKTLGRPRQSKVTKKLNDNKDKILELLELRVPKDVIADKFSISRATLYTWMRADKDAPKYVKRAD